MPVQTQLQQRRGTAASWTSTNPTLAAGEIGFETDTGKFKIGNGSTAWAALAYSAGATAVTYLFNATSGQTTFSGADANGLTLAYTVGAEQVYLNGVLQVRGSDYTASNGTSIVLTSGALTSDVLNVIAYSAMTITDTYTQAQADAKFYQLAFNNAGGKNSIVNGGFDVWQRGTTFSNITAAPYTADRFQGSIGSMTGGTLSLSRQSSGLAGFQYALRFQRNSGATTTGAGYFTYSMETENVIPLQGKTVTFSFYARAGANFSMGGSAPYLIMNSGTGTNENINNGLTGSTTIISQTPVLTTSWQRFTYNASVPSNATSLGFYLQYNGSGTAGANDYYDVTGFQLELGSIATPFARAGGTIAGELAACQRYYVRYTCETGAPYAVFAPSGFVETSTNAICYTTLPVTLRSYPVSVEYGGSLTIIGTSGSFAVTGIALQDRTNNKVVAITYVSSGMTATTAAAVRANNSSTAYLGINAEL